MSFDDDGKCECWFDNVVVIYELRLECGLEFVLDFVIGWFFDLENEL